MKKSKLSTKPVPFHKKDMKTKQKHMLYWFVDETSVNTVLNNTGILLGEESVETIPENIPSSVKDKHVDINGIRSFFDSDGWLAVQSVYTEACNMPWLCAVCASNLDAGDSICCDCCLCWSHLQCTKLKKSPKGNWFCAQCK